MSNIGYSTLSVIPSARGFGAALTKGIAPEMAVAGKASGMSFGKAMAAGIASTALIGVGVITGLGAVGKTFHDMESTIRVGTGKSGAALDGLVASALNVGRKVPSSFEDIGKTVTALNVRLGLTGAPLETLARQALVAGRITKSSLDLNSLTGSFNAFNIKGKDTVKGLDDLFRVSQATGTPINELTAAVAKGAPAFRQFGLSFSTSAALIGVLDKAGINSGKTIAALTIGLTKFAKEGKAPGPALRSTIDQITKFTKSGKDAAAIKLAASIFGTRGAAQFVAAVKSGKVNLDDMMKSAGAGNDTILKAGTAVSTFSSKWGVFKNNVLIAVKPLADAVFKAFGDGMQFMSDVGLPALQKYGAELSAKVMPVLRAFGGFIAGTVVPALFAFGGALLAVGGFLTSHTGLVKAAAVVVGVLTVAVLAHNVALFVSTGALKAWILQTTIVKTATATWAAIQWVLNAAIWANPVTWIVVGIIALIAVIVLIATKTTWFQTAWTTMTNAVGAAWRWLWNTILAPVFRFILDGVGSIIGGISNMLLALGHVPGFGWATDAGNAMKSAAAQAHALANGITDIPDKKVKLSVTATISNAALRVLNLAPSQGKLLKVGANGFASGGVVPGSGFGDTQPAMLTPGEFVVRRDGSNITDALNHFGAKAATPTAGFDYDRMAAAMSRAQIVLDGKNVATSVDQRLAPR